MNADLPIPELAAHFRRKFSIHVLSAGLNEDLLEPAPDRFALTISCCIGTRSLSPPSLFPAPTPYGVFIIPKDATNKDRGLLVDDEIKPFRLNLNEDGNIVTLGYDFNAYTANYTLAIWETFYMPKLT